MAPFAQRFSTPLPFTLCTVPTLSLLLSRFGMNGHDEIAHFYQPQCGHLSFPLGRQIFRMRKDGFADLERAASIKRKTEVGKRTMPHSTVIALL